MCLSRYRCIGECMCGEYRTTVVVIQLHFYYILNFPFAKSTRARRALFSVVEFVVFTIYDLVSKVEPIKRDRERKEYDWKNYVRYCYVHLSL